MVSNKVLTIWFTDQGDLMTHSKSWMITRNQAKSEEGVDFTDSMEYVRMWDGGNNASRVELKSTKSGRKYSMFLDDFNAIILARMFVDNTIEGTFRFIKRGTAQSIKLLLPEKP